MSRKSTILWLLLLSVIGLADALYLTYDHGAFHADPAGYGGGLCGADGGCSISRSSVLSEIPLPGAQLGLPTSVLALGFYAVFIVLTLLRAKTSRDAEVFPGSSDPATKTRLASFVRLQLGLAVLANAYSLFLLGYSLAEGSVCKFCAVLYAVNLGLLFVTWRSLGESLASAMRATWKAVVSRAGAVALLVMLVVLAGGYIVYRGTVLAAREAAPVIADVDVTGRPAAGPPDAKVHIIEFADFECPHCKIAFKTFEDVLAERKDVRVSFLHFPLDQACNPVIDRPFHQRACELAMIGECAHQQGKFFEAAPLLFEVPPKEELLQKLVAKGLDAGALEACVKDAKVVERIREDIKAGLAAKIEGTPAVFLNGVRVGGVVPKDKLNGLIDLAKQAPTLTNKR